MNPLGQITVSQKYLTKIKELHTDKVKINQDKMASIGHINNDDHGFIPFPEFHFEAKPNHPEGYVKGPKAIGENFRAYLNALPDYINEHSALATCWIGFITDFMKIDIVPEDRDPELDQIWDRYQIIQSGFGAMNHMGPDMTIGLELGWGGLLNKIRHYREKNQPLSTDFYDGEEALVLGIREWIRSHVDYAHKCASKEADDKLRAHYLDIAHMNEWLIDHPARSLREACQFIAHFQSVDRMYFAGGALSQLDEVLRPYYERDVAAGIVTDEEAVWYIASLFFNDTHYSQIAGLKVDGKEDMTSQMSFIILEAMHLLNIPANIALRVHDDVNQELFKRSLIYTMEDGSGVDYSLNVGCEEGYALNGFPIQVARQRAKVGCNWTALPGREYPLQDVTRVNMAYAFVEAMEDLAHLEEQNLSVLWDGFINHTSLMIDSIKRGYDRHYEVVSPNKPEIVLNLFMHGPIEKGLNAAEGGVDNISFCIDGIALATVADSFAAIEQRLVDEGRITWDKLFEVLDKNYEDEERIRLMMKNIDRFGTPNSLAEKWALRIRDFFVDYAKSPTPTHNLKVIPGMFSHGDVFMYGNQVPATPNGRRAKEPISHSNEPDPGFARGIHSFSPTLKATAVAKVQPGLGNSSPLHLDIDKTMVENEGGVEALMALIQTHNQMGGTLINLNCMTKEKLLDAHEHPDKYPDLVVRVTGYSAFFSSLSKDYRQQIVDRFLAL